jgi:hypothetical protein
MQGHLMMCQRCKSSSDIELRLAGDTDMKMQEMKVDKLLDKCKNLFTRRWDSRPVWTLVESVKDNVHRSWSGNCEHIL